MSPLHTIGEDDYSEESDADSVWREADDWLYEHVPFDDPFEDEVDA